jgi:hypothetical protein
VNHHLRAAARETLRSFGHVALDVFGASVEISAQNEARGREFLAADFENGGIDCVGKPMKDLALVRHRMAVGSRVERRELIVTGRRAPVGSGPEERPGQRPRQYQQVEPEWNLDTGREGQ